MWRRCFHQQLRERQDRRCRLEPGLAQGCQQVPVIHHHSVGAAGRCAPARVCEISNVGQGSGRGGSGWGCPRPAGTSSVRYAGSVQEVALELVTEQETPGGPETPRWYRETHARRGDNDVAPTASSHKG